MPIYSQPNLPGVGQYITPICSMTGYLAEGVPVKLNSSEIYKIVHYFKFNNKNDYKIFIISIDDKLKLITNQFGYNTEEFTTICAYYSDFNVVNSKLANTLSRLYD